MMEGVVAVSGVRQGVDVSIVMPCLDEAQALPACISNARDALARMRCELGFAGEIVVADNGSADGSQSIARELGARVVEVAQRGYGAALIAGLDSADGTYLVMGDADGSYDFRDSVTMVRRLVEGADLCVGSRFQGHIEPGAMPWKNRYIGNPALTLVLNIFFRAGVSDAHCGLRALTKSSFQRLGLSGTGMEFASEMIIKAALKHERIVEAPASLSCDLRNRAPHLRPWRDGWRHLRYLLMLSPAWVFAVPGAFAALAAIGIFAVAGAMISFGAEAVSPFGNYWIILAGALLGLAHVAGLLAAATHLHGRQQGYRKASVWEASLARWATLETMLISGGLSFLAGVIVLLAVLGYWSNHHFGRIGTVLPAVIGTTLIVIGAQNALGGFLLAIVNGHDTEFVKEARVQSAGGEAQPSEDRKKPTRAIAC